MTAREVIAANPKTTAAAGGAAGFMAVMGLMSLLANPLTVTTPVEGTVLKDSVALVATGEEGISKLNFVLQHATLPNKCVCPATEGPAGTYTATLDTKQTIDGSYTLVAQSFEPDGVTVRETSPLVALSVNNAPQPTPTPTPTVTPSPSPTGTPNPPFPNDYIKLKDGIALNGERFYSSSSGYMRRVRTSGLDTYLLPNRLAEAGAWGLEFMFVQGVPVVHDTRANFNKWYQWNEQAVRLDLYNGTGAEPVRPGGTPTPTPTVTPTPTPTSTVTPTPTPTGTPPADPCVALPLKITSLIWPSSQVGQRSGAWNSGIFTLVKAGFEWSPSLRFVAIDSRGCSLVIVK